MKKVLVLAPRLDVTFKEGPVPTERGLIVPIRVHWMNFVIKVAEEHRSRGDEVSIIELPLWQFTPKIVEDLHPDIVYIPHKERRSFPVSAEIDARYYMQTVFPWRFYIDSMGWAGGSSIYPATELVTRTPNSRHHFSELKQYILSGGSKFEQPPISGITLPRRFVFFPCQIPHDETIKYHSSISVEGALQRTAAACQDLGIPLIVKGHPINPASMSPLKDICDKYRLNTTWIDNVSIHEIIPKAKVVVCVNSGTGMESLLHSIPVITFGRCEYDIVTMRANGDDTGIKTMITLPLIDMNTVEKFFNNWCEWTYSTQSSSTDFNRLT